MRSDSSSFLSDIQTLKDKTRALEEEREDLKQEIALLKIQKSSGKISPGLSSNFDSKKPNSIATKDIRSPSQTFGKSNNIVSPTQSIQTIQEKDDNFNDFQKISADLLSSARSSNRSSVLGPMKNILLFCKKISQDCEGMEQDSTINDDDKDALHEAKSKLSGDLSKLMQATKEHASGSGASLFTKIEKELSRLSFCVSDILELIKIIESNRVNISLPRSSKRDTLRSVGGAFSTHGGGELPPMKIGELRVRFLFFILGIP
jgi:hypothetical protein